MMSGLSRRRAGETHALASAQRLELHAELLGRGTRDLRRRARACRGRLRGGPWRCGRPRGADARGLPRRGRGGCPRRARGGCFCGGGRARRARRPGRGPPGALRLQRQVRVALARGRGPACGREPAQARKLLRSTSASNMCICGDSYVLRRYWFLCRPRCAFVLLVGGAMRPGGSTRGLLSSIRSIARLGTKIPSATVLSP